MPEIPWTPQQRRAIETVGRSVIVSAAAGSGKTAVLVERCVYLVCDAPLAKRCRVDELLVVTFTEAAAAQMRSRIRKRLQERLTAHPNDDHLGMQVALLDTMRISTVHAFCLWLIRRWFNKVGVDPAATVLAADEAGILKADTLAEIIADRYARQDEIGQAFRNLVDTYGLGRDEGIVRYVLRLAEFLDSLPDPDRWMDQACERFADRPDGVLRDLSKTLGLELRLQAEHGQRWAATADSSDRRTAFYGRKLTDHADQLACWQAGVQDVREALSNGKSVSSDLMEKMDLILQEMAGYSLSARGAPRRGHDDNAAAAMEQEAAQAAFKRAQELFKKRLCDRFARFSTAQMLSGLAATAPYGEAIIDLVRSFRRAYADAKRRRDVLDFADQERYAYRLLSMDDVAEAVRRRFAYVLIDEYQDINPLQADLLRRASREDDPACDANLFTVGDVKQSIYRFRSAEPRLFLDRLKRCPANKKRGSALFLPENYRSRTTILEGVNRVFSVLMRPEIGPIAYGERQALRSRRAFGKGATPFTSIDVHLLDRRMSLNDETEEEASQRPTYVDPDDPVEWQAVERESYVMAMEIRRMFAEGMTLEGGKKITLSDIAILVRTGKYVIDAISRFLNRFGIDVQGTVARPLFGAQEIRDLRSLLEVLDNMQQDIPLAALLRSPVLGDRLSEDDLMAIRAMDRTAPFHETVRRFAADGSDEGLKRRLTRLLNRIRRYRRAARLRAFPEVLWELIEGSGYLAYVGGLPGGAQRRANLLRFFERARQFGTFKQQGIRRFLQFLDSLERQGSDPGTATVVNPSRDAVQIMSIHASKGLEFPIVFLADLGRRFNLDDTRGRMILDRDAGIGLKVIDRERMIEYPGVIHHLAAAGIELETRSEELRVLYVAMTRAMERLVLVGSTPFAQVDRARAQAATGEGGITSLSIATALKPLDWLVPILAQMPEQDADWSGSGSRRGSPLFRIVTHDGEEMAKWRIEPREKTQASPLLHKASRLEPLPPDEPAAPDLAPVENVLNRVRFDYPHLAVASIPAVVAASEVKRSHSVVHDPDERPSLFLEFTGGADMTSEAVGEMAGGSRVDREAAQLRGIATHKVLQHLDFTLACNDRALGVEMDRMVASSLLSRDEADLVDTEHIAWFVTTPLAQRIRDAGATYVREFMFIASQPAQWFDDTLDADLQEGVLVRGMVDGVLPCDGGIEVIDFKTDRVQSEKVAQGSRRYHRQMQLYAASIEPIFQKPVTCCRLVFLHPHRIVSIAGTEYGAEFE